MSILAASKQDLVRVSFIAALAVFSLSAVAQDDTRRKAQFENRLGAVKALSMALSSDPGSARPEAKAVIAKVGARQKEAEELAAVGEYDAARMILDEGYGLLTRTLAAMKSGTGYSGPSGAAAAEGAASASRQTAFDRMLASARSLLEAARRSSAEVGGGKATELSRIESTIGAAEQAGKAGDFGRGESLANDAMKELRPLLVSIKGGTAGSAGTAAPADGEQEKARRLATFDNRLASAKAMADALKRQNQEKRAGKDSTIEDIEIRLRQAETLRGADVTAAQGLLDEAYNTTKLALQSIQASAPSKSSSAMEAATGGGAAAQRAEIDRILKSSALLREAVARVSKEKGTDSSAVLARIDTLSADARNRQASDPERALQTANEANQTAKDALAKIR